MHSGFSLVEMLISISLTLGVMAVVFQAMDPAHGSFRAEPETADVQQRLRVGVDVLSLDLLAAGAGPSQGRNAAPLNEFLAPILPYRQGRRRADPPGTYRTDTITSLHAIAGAAQTTIAQALTASSSSVQVNLEPGCPPSDPVCGFKSGMSVLVFDGSGAYDTFTIRSVDGFALTLQHDMADSSKSYAPSVSRIVQVASRTFYLKSDRATNAYQLMQYDGAGGADVPVVDDVVGLSFEYLADPEPPRMRRPLTDAVGPWTTYGPKPPDSGDNCVFVGNGTPTPAPRLSVLSNSPRLVRLTAVDLTDGPWCPDGVNPNRYDADLLRIRSIAITYRVEASASAVRGPAGPLFVRPGTSSSGRARVQDQEIRFELSPRNLNTRR